ncbi:polysaccharide pyruvyl transferase family protein [Candidatus Peregrinibacteria bacterium]|nr:polysaccharide pyruvyl transferase family protein [Candidatus Peregrinibacteria bacterium]
MKNLLICGNYGATNFGDEMILAALLQHIRFIAPKTHITVLSADPSHTKVFHKVESVFFLPFGFRSFFRGLFRGELMKTFQAYRKADAVLIGGGGLFTDERIYAIFLWGFHVLVAIICFKPFYIYAQSIGPLRYFLSRSIVSFLFKKAQRISVRDYASKKLLIALGIHKPILVLPDPALSLNFDKHEVENRFRLFSARYELKNGSYCIVVMRDWMKKVSHFESIVAESIDEIVTRKKLKVLLIPFQTYRDDDRFILNKIFEQIRNKKNVHLLDFSLHSRDFYDYISLFSHAKFIIGMRLHSLILSFRLGIPFIPLVYSPKVSRFLDMQYFDRLVLHVEKVNALSLRKSITFLFEHYNEIRSDIIASEGRMKPEHRLHFSFLRSCIFPSS